MKKGEYERPDGKYEYRYSVFGKSFSFYANTLEELREKEKDILSEKNEINQTFNRRTTTLNDIYGLWKELKRGIRHNTYSNYCYMYDQYVKDSIGDMYVS